MTNSLAYDADAAIEKLKTQDRKIKLGGKVYVADVPTLDDQAEIAKLLPSAGDAVSDEFTREAAEGQVDSIRKQIQRFLKTEKAPHKPPSDADIGKLPARVAGEILAAINRDTEDEPGN